MIECLLCLAISPFFSTYNSSIQSEPGVSISLGNPFYISASYEAPDMRIVGQYMPTKAVGASLGYVYGINEKFSLFIEGGYYWPETSPLDVVENEIVEQVLVNDHGHPTFKPTYFEYELEPGFGGKVGFDISLHKHLSIFGAYRFLKLDETYKMCNIEEACTWPVPEGGRYWVNSQARDYSSIQIGFSLRI